MLPKLQQKNIFYRITECIRSKQKTYFPFFRQGISIVRSTFFLQLKSEVESVTVRHLYFRLKKGKGVYNGIRVSRTVEKIKSYATRHPHA